MCNNQPLIKTNEKHQLERDALLGVINRFIGYFTRQTVPQTGNDTTAEYPFVAMDTRQAFEQLCFVRRYLDSWGVYREGLKFIDIGCGIGNILLLAEMLDFNVVGIEKDPASLKIAKNLVDDNAVLETDIWSYQGLNTFDVLYYFRPFCERTRQERFEHLVEDQCKPGAILVANRKMSDTISTDHRFSKISSTMPIWRKLE